MATHTKRTIQCSSSYGGQNLTNSQAFAQKYVTNFIADDTQCRNASSNLSDLQMCCFTVHKRCDLNTVQKMTTSSS